MQDKIGFQKCKLCHQIKPLSDFGMTRNRYLLKTCQYCRYNRQVILNRNRIENSHTIAVHVPGWGYL